MDNSAQDSANLNPTDQSGGTIPQSTSQTLSEEQAAAARGDSSLNVQDSIQKVAGQENEDMSKLNFVSDAEDTNNENLLNSIGAKGPHSISDQGKSSDQIRKLGEKVETCIGLPDGLRQILIDRVARLAMIRSSAGFLSSNYILEYESASHYINWAVGMPWNKKSEDMLDLAKAKEVMDKNHYGLIPLKERVLEYIASIMLDIKNSKEKEHIIKAPILCMVGLAGTGKTTFAKSLADALGRQFERIPFGGMADSRVLRGQSRYFPDAEPGAIIKQLSQGKTKNPVILLDELDRVTDTARADIMGVLIELLDPEQNANFADHYIDYPFNLQDVIFVATANNINSVATAVLDRLEIIHMPSYSDEEKIVIGRDYILPKTKKSTGLLPEQLTITEDVWAPLVRPLGYDPGVRGLDRLLSNMCRKAAMQIVTGAATTVTISSDNMKHFLPEW